MHCWAWEAGGIRQDLGFAGLDFTPHRGQVPFCFPDPLTRERLHRGPCLVR